MYCFSHFEQMAEELLCFSVVSNQTFIAIFQLNQLVYFILIMFVLIEE